MASANWSLAGASNVFTVRDDRFPEITTFIGPNHFAPFGLPIEPADRP